MDYNGKIHNKLNWELVFDDEVHINEDSLSSKTVFWPVFIPSRSCATRVPRALSTSIEMEKKYIVTTTKRKEMEREATRNRNVRLL